MGIKGPRIDPLLSFKTSLCIVIIFLGTSISHTTHLAEPIIISNLGGHAFEGETFDLNCSVATPDNIRPLIRWKTPLDGNSDQLNNTTGAILTVTNAQKSDEGNYTCIVQDHFRNPPAYTKYLMTISKISEIILYNIDNNTVITNAMEDITLNVTFRSLSAPFFHWYAPDLRLIQPSEKYKINQTNSSIHLQIKHLTTFDNGEYILKANNDFEEKKLTFKLYVKSKPQIITNNVYVRAGERAKVNCKIYGYPLAVATITFFYCKLEPKWPTCEEYVDIPNSTRTSSKDSYFAWNNEISFKTVRPGRMRCTGNNTLGGNTNDSYVLIGDITDNMSVYKVDDGEENLQIARGDEVTIECAALAYFYTADLKWFKDNRTIISGGDGVEVKTSYSNFTHKKTIKFMNMGVENIGNYECRAKHKNGGVDFDNKFLNISDIYEPELPVIVKTNVKGLHERTRGESLELICKCKGLPKPSVTWFKDDEKLNESSGILISKDKTVLKIPIINSTHEGLYKCEALNRLGRTESITELRITIQDRPGLNHEWIIVVFIVILIILIIVYLGFRIRNEREIIYQLKLAGLQNFEKGALEQINPKLSLDEQADLLPYDRRFEFPRNKLKLGKQLGSGAFGVVLEAVAEGIIPDEKETVVAVKMVKQTGDNEIIKALLSELKIMVHLGKHLNVVNLLGAVTKNIVKREVMVIVEYCCYGNIQNCLLRNQTRFVNQISPNTDKIDPTIVDVAYATIDFGIDRNLENKPNCDVDLEESLYVTEDSVKRTMSEEYQLMSNYKPNTTDEGIRTIRTSDLVSWAFQVARGMDYLSSRKVIHGDLAARNILLCKNNIVKICDFGLARSMYKSDKYQKQSQSPLPMKWLALESLSYQTFSTYSDVWSFGVMLWEFFSLATVPYPEIYSYEILYTKLRAGYRMEKPVYANKELYDVMLKCWSASPQSRPLFNQLEKIFATMLGEDVKNQYEVLNEPYVKMNSQNLRKSETFLTLMAAPDAMITTRYDRNRKQIPTNQVDLSDDLEMISRMECADLNKI